MAVIDLLNLNAASIFKLLAAVSDYISRPVSGDENMNVNTINNIIIYTTFPSGRTNAVTTYSSNTANSNRTSSTIFI